MKIKRTETIYNGFYTFRKVILEDKGEEIEREQFDSGGAAAALLYDTTQDKYIFVKQFRYSAETDLVEVVAGVVEDNDPEKTILKEIEEETGYKADHIEHIWDFFTSPGACTEVVHLYYAEVSAKTEKGGGLDDEHENIEIITLTEEELLSHPLSHPLRDAKTIIAVQWLAARLGKIPQKQETSIKK
ncbi:NUDIX hydrolase [Pontibacter diazotrophicus]|uniref:GDP-mannose pyrophosphatase n=1 Tax=Pontibacter diazotrophicus TaxID=1400979 RepID=A0A3D8LC13_9BACT|nr:NUDIX hydrolase [Pontibacter diazotrophicus]RDV14940.1 NUDIX hydrolase [Pontibacter diazotrophicus]